MDETTERRRKNGASAAWDPYTTVWDRHVLVIFSLRKHIPGLSELRRFLSFVTSCLHLDRGLSSPEWQNNTVTSREAPARNTIAHTYGRFPRIIDLLPE